MASNYHLELMNAEDQDHAKSCLDGSALIAFGILKVSLMLTFHRCISGRIHKRCILFCFPTINRVCN